MAQDSSKPDFWDTRYANSVMPWDEGGVPDSFIEYAQTVDLKEKILIPGCGSAYEVAWLGARGHDVLGIEFSPIAVQAARTAIGKWADQIMLADFFEFPVSEPFHWVYERAFLCALPQKTWSDYAARMAQLIHHGGHLAGFFFLKETQKGPPFGISASQLDELLSPYFELRHTQLVDSNIELFKQHEYWMTWQRK